MSWLTLTWTLQVSVWVSHFTLFTTTFDRGFSVTVTNEPSVTVVKLEPGRCDWNADVITSMWPFAVWHKCRCKQPSSLHPHPADVADQPWRWGVQRGQPAAHQLVHILQGVHPLEKVSPEIKSTTTRHRYISVMKIHEDPCLHSVFKKQLKTSSPSINPPYITSNLILPSPLPYIFDYRSLCLSLNSLRLVKGGIFNVCWMNKVKHVGLTAASEVGGVCSSKRNPERYSCSLGFPS